ELEKRMATMYIKVDGTELVIIKTVHTLLKRSEGIEAINGRLGIVENKMNELFMQHKEFVSVKDKTSK
ncbi:hypothetical protein CHS0354_039349, partial [Potamilus streckersoni]